MKWQAKTSVVPQTIDQVKQLLIANRNIHDEQLFFSPPAPTTLGEADHQLSPASLKRAVDRIIKAGEKGEEVVLFGDYDADGVCATAILWEVMHHMGVRVRPILPDRFKHGYGLNQKSLANILETGPKPDLLITVDNGIVAHAALQQLKELGTEILLTDHHQPEGKFPPHDVLLHTTTLCGAGIAWVLANELDTRIAANSLDLAAIATVADQVLLSGANRSLVYHGLQALKKTKRLGLVELFKVAGIVPAAITEKTIGYVLAPRINAMGRLGSPLEALRLICTKDQRRAALLADIVNQRNVDRQQLTQQAVIEAELQADLQKEDQIQLVKSRSFHEGVIGLIAGKLVEQYGKPAIVLAVNDTFAKGSARSYPGVNIVELLRQCRYLLIEVGGHPMAAGCGLLPANIADLKTALEAAARNNHRSDPILPYDFDLPEAVISTELAAMLPAFAPFGPGNENPIFHLLEPSRITAQQFGKENNHTKLIIQSAERIEVIYWNRLFSDAAEIKDSIYCQFDKKDRYGLHFVGL